MRMELNMDDATIRSLEIEQPVSRCSRLITAPLLLVSRVNGETTKVGRPWHADEIWATSILISLK